MNFNSRTQKRMFELARKAQKNAYAPYSKHKVGAAVLASSGKIYTGVNVENSVYPSGCCAEQSAVSACILAGEKSIKEALTVTPKGGPPCGQCRQILAEFATPKALVHICSSKKIVDTLYLDDLLPGKFLKTHLPQK